MKGLNFIELICLGISIAGVIKGIQNEDALMVAMSVYLLACISWLRSYFLTKRLEAGYFK